MIKTITVSEITCDFCKEKIDRKSYNDEWGKITLFVTGVDYNGNAAGGHLFKEGDVCCNCLKKIRNMIIK